MLVSLYTYFISDSKLNVRVHECHCGDEPQYHPPVRDMYFYDKFIKGRETAIRAMAGVSYVSLRNEELFIVTDGTLWSALEDEVLAVMAKLDEFDLLTMTGRLVFEHWQQSPTSSTKINDLYNANGDTYKDQKPIIDLNPSVEKLRESRSIMAKELFGKAVQAPPYRIDPDNYRHPYDRPIG